MLSKFFLFYDTPRDTHVFLLEVIWFVCCIYTCWYFLAMNLYVMYDLIYLSFGDHKC